MFLFKFYRVHFEKKIVFIKYLIQFSKIKCSFLQYVFKMFSCSYTMNINLISIKKNHTPTSLFYYLSFAYSYLFVIIIIIIFITNVIIIIIVMDIIIIIIIITFLNQICYTKSSDNILKNLHYAI